MFRSDWHGTSPGHLELLPPSTSAVKVLNLKPMRSMGISQSPRLCRGSALMPFAQFYVVVLAVRLEDVLNNVLQSVGSYQASGSARVDDESVDSLTFY